MENPDNRPGIREWLALTVLMLVWGSSFILIKKGLVSFNSLEVGALRISISFMVLLPFAVRSLRQISRTKLRYFVMAGVFGNGIPPFLFARAQTVIDSYLAGVLNSLTPLFTLLIGLMLFGRKTRWVNVLGVFIGLIGAIGLLSVVHDPELGNGMWYGLLVVVAAICYAVNMNIIKTYLAGYDALTITSSVFAIIGLPALIFLFAGTSFTHTMVTHPESWKSLGYIALLAIVGTAASMVLHNWLIRRTSALFASTVTYLMPVISIFWGIIDGEAFLLLYLFWIVMILIGVYLANRPARHRHVVPANGKSE
jgi:drug/metabolite transporter (DMT)-like permease